MAEVIQTYGAELVHRELIEVVNCIKKGGLVIFPTDALYCIGCDFSNPKALNKLAKFKKVKENKLNLSLIFENIKSTSIYLKNLDRGQFRLLNQCFPGPFTFILKSSNELPKWFKNKKTVGVRIPNHIVPQQIVSELGFPMAATTCHADDSITEYLTDPEDLFDKYERFADILIDSGNSDIVPTTVVNLTENSPELIRMGKGEIDLERF